MNMILQAKLHFSVVCLQDKRLVPGGGATEIELAKQITSYGEVQQIFLTLSISVVTYILTYIDTYLCIKVCVCILVHIYQQKNMEEGTFLSCCFFQMLMWFSTSLQTCPGLDQYAIKKFAEAFEAIPRALAENSGIKANEVISKLYAVHQEGNKNVGFDIEVSSSSHYLLLSSTGLYLKVLLLQ